MPVTAHLPFDSSPTDRVREELRHARCETRVPEEHDTQNNAQTRAAESSGITMSHHASPTLQLGPMIMRHASRIPLDHAKHASPAADLA